MRFLHLADLHLDAPYVRRGPELGARLRNATRLALQGAVDTAIDEQVHAVLVAGDLFDGAALSFETESFLLEQLRRLERASIPFLYATGNHDPTAKVRAIDWPDNVVLFAQRNPTTTLVRDQHGRPVGRVSGAGHEMPRETENLAARFPRHESTSSPADSDALPHVGLLHAQVDDAAVEGHAPYAPCSTQDLRDAAVDYWALGHVHRRQRVCENPPAWYPGSPQGQTPREAGQRGANLVTLTKEEPARVEFVPLQALRWETVTVSDLETLRHVQALIEEIRQRDSVQAVAQQGGTQLLMRVQLEGGSPIHRELQHPENVQFLERELADELGVLDVEVGCGGLVPPVDLARVRKRPDVLGEAVRLFDLLHERDDLVRELAPTSLAGHSAEEDPVAYIRELLRDGDRELTERLLGLRS